MNYKTIGEVIPYDCGVGGEGQFKLVCSCVDMYSCGSCDMWCLVRVGDDWWVESGPDHV